MTVRRLDHIGIVVGDLAAATAFFVELGLTSVGEAAVEGAWVDRIIGLHGVRSRIVMLETPDGHSRVELSTFDSPPSPDAAPSTPSNTPGLRHLAFEVGDLDDAISRLRPHGAELVGQVCYVRGPEGIIVELAQRLS